MNPGDWVRYKSDTIDSSKASFFRQIVKRVDSRYAHCRTIKLDGEGKLEYLVEQDSLILPSARPCTPDELNAISIALFEAD